MEKKQKKSIILIFIIFIIMICFFEGMREELGTTIKNTEKNNSDNTFKIISSTENKDIEEIIQNYAKKNNIDVSIDYAGTIEIMSKLNNGEKYDAVWCSNSIWLYMLDSKIKTTNSKSTSINPVVFGIKKSKAEELGFIGKDVYMKDILEAINQGKLKFNMSSPTQTNTGATAYLGFLTTLAGNPEILTEENLQNEELKDQLIQLYSGVKRSSGDDEFLQEMFLKGNYEALITYETSLINMNKQLEQKGEEPLYAIYTKDGVSISDSPFAYIDNKDDAKLEEFKKIQNYILSNEGQAELVKTGRRVWFGGINENADKTVFNPNWGIDTTKYIVPVKYPSTAVIKTALGIYQTELRKPINIVFCLDYSGSMYGSGSKQLIEAMQYILNEEEASKDLLQFSNKDKITIIPFNHEILGEYTTRATLDIDFVDLGYPAKYGKVFVLLRDYDMLEYQSTILSPNYKERATKLEEFKYINVYILSKEDVAVSKIIRLAEKDIEDLNQIIPKCDKKILNNVIEEVLNREDLFDSKKNEFVKKLKTFREKYNV